MSEVKAREFTNWIHNCKSPHKEESICVQKCDQVQSIELTAEVKNAIKSYYQLQSENKQLREKLEKATSLTSKLEDVISILMAFGYVEEVLEIQYLKECIKTLKQLTQNGGEDEKT